MMIPEMGELFNRTSKVLFARFDGIDYELKPGLNVVPKVVIPYAKNQNILMGSENAVDPSDYEVLVGVPGRDDCSPLEQSEEEPTRVRLSDVVGDNVKIVKKGRKKRSNFEAQVPGASDGGGILSERT